MNMRYLISDKYIATILVICLFMVSTYVYAVTYHAKEKEFAEKFIELLPDEYETKSIYKEVQA